jgi:hypothetical protein
MGRSSGNDLLVAASRHGEPLILTREQRSRHLYVTGSTGSGKSKFLEYLIRQDIMNWRKSGECGLLLLDPHGAIYDGLMAWLARTSYIYERPVVPIDLRRDDWVVAYNLLRQREKVAASVVTDNLVDALAYVWGAGARIRRPFLPALRLPSSKRCTNTSSHSWRPSRSSSFPATSSGRPSLEAPRTRRPASLSRGSMP